MVLDFPITLHSKTDTLRTVSDLREVPDAGTLLCLGDISVREDACALDCLAELKAQKNLTMWLVHGNHDRIHPMFGLDSVVTWTPAYREVFDVIALELQIRIGRWQVLMTHIPRATGKDAVPDPHQTQTLARWAGREGFECTVNGHSHSSVEVRRKHVNLSLEELVPQAVRFRG